MELHRAAAALRRECGLTLTELLFTISLLITTMAIALPITAEAVDALRTAAAARYLAGRINLARMEAVKRSANVALRFEPSSGDFRFATYLDRNRNGVRTLDIRQGVDIALTAAERLSDNFSAVRFGLMEGIPDIDGGRIATDGVRIGSAGILTMSANGTATSGTLYVRGRRRQFAVRVLGATGRTRVLFYDTGERKWISR